jgi:hypothetical protein
MNTEKQSIIATIGSSANTIDRTKIVDEVSRSKDRELIIAMLDAFNELNAGEKGNALAVSAVGLYVNIPAGNGKPLRIDYLSRQEILLSRSPSS